MLHRSVEIGTTETKALAVALCLSEETVDTYWKRVKAGLKVAKRYEAIRVARNRGILNEVPDMGNEKMGT